MSARWSSPNLFMDRRDLLRYGSLTGLAVAAGFGPQSGKGGKGILQPRRESSGLAPGKTESTYYTPDKVANARSNVDRFPWAAAQRDAAVAAAAEFIEQDDAALWELVPGQGVSRSLGVLIRYQQRIKGSPGPEGAEINEHGNYPWLIDSGNHPWKIQSPVTGERYPSNDFASFYQSGLDEHGLFDRELALEQGSQFLTNELYPERGPEWGVDDGMGWTDEDGDTWTFIAYYAHWGLWNRLGEDQPSYGYIIRALIALRDAYLYTGESVYARKGLVLLDRIADVYPEMDVSAYRWEDGFDNGDPEIHTAQGKILHDIWETSVVRNFILAYDAFYPATESETALLEFVQAQVETYALPFTKDTPADLRQHIEDRILREVYPAVQNSQIRGNQGMHQGVLGLAAVVLDEEQTSQEWLDFVYQSGHLIKQDDPGAPYGRRWTLTGGDVGRVMIDDVDRDGAGFEGAPQYNVGWVNNFRALADYIDGYQRYPDYDLFSNVKFLQMFRSYHPLVMLSQYTPPIGDSGVTGAPGLLGGTDTDVLGFEQTSDPALAQLVHLRNGNSTDGLHGSIFDAEPGGIAEVIEDVIDEYGPFDPGDSHLTGFGFAALRAGAGEQARGLWMYYGRSIAHGHRDTLNLGVYGSGMDLAPDLGYPEVTGTDPERLNWTSATVSHNTVVVDEQSQDAQWVALPQLIGEGERVSLVEVEAPGVYSQTTLYRRTAALVQIDEHSSYIVDFFRVAGGQEHVLSLHGGPGALSTDGLDLTEQAGGSYAGPDVPFQDPDYNANGRRSGFNYLDNVARDTAPNGTFVADWTVADNWDVHDQPPEAHLRATVLTDVDEVAFADGVPPRNKPGNPARLRYLLARREGTDLHSNFVSVLEPFEAERKLHTIERVPVRTPQGEAVDEFEAAAVKVTHPADRVDYVISARDGDSAYVVDDRLEFQGRFGLAIMVEDRIDHRYLHTASRLTEIGDDEPDSLSALTGRVLRFTEELEARSELVIRLDEPIARDIDDLPLLHGTHIHIDTDGERNAVYRIQGIEQERDGAPVYIVDIAHQTPIRALRDAEDLEAGYIYDIRRGARLVIPVAHEIS